MEITAVQEKIPVKVAVFNNGALGFVELEMKVRSVEEEAVLRRNPCHGGVQRRRDRQP